MLSLFSLGERSLGRWLVPESRCRDLFITCFSESADFILFCFFLKDFWDIQIKACLKSGDFRAVVLDLQSYVRWNKNPLQSSFSWIQFYSSVGQKAARIACSVTEEKINFRIISTCIYVWVKTIPFYSHCSVVSGRILSVVPSLYQQVKVNFNVGQCAVP